MTEFRSIGKFEYKAPESLPGALMILEAENRACKVMAGGTDLILQMKQGLANPSSLLDVKRIPELNRLGWSEKDGLYIGAAVPFSRLLAFSELPKEVDILRQACSLIGSIQIKNRGSIGGNICNAAPSADSAPPLLCLEAGAVLASNRGNRTLPLDAFFLGPGKTALADDELLVKIEIRKPPAPSAGCYLRHTTREEMDIAVASVASLLSLSPQTGELRSVRIALGAVAPTPRRASEAEAFLTGKKITEAMIEEAAEKAAEAADPVSDIRASSEYRLELVRVLTRRTLRRACESLGIEQ